MKKVIICSIIFCIWIILFGCGGSKNNPVTQDNTIKNNDYNLPTITSTKYKSLNVTSRDYEVAQITGLSVDYIIYLRSIGLGYGRIIQVDNVSDITGYSIDYILEASHVSEGFGEIVKLLGLKKEDFAKFTYEDLPQSIQELIDEGQLPQEVLNRIIRDYYRSQGKWITVGEAITRSLSKEGAQGDTYGTK